MKQDYSNYILSSDQRYSIPGLNQIMFISHKQTLSLVLGSCVSTVFIGKSEDNYLLAANHIVIADQKGKSIVATKDAQMQIDLIIEIYIENYGIKRENLTCLHLIGGGFRGDDKSSNINRRNIDITKGILEDMKIPLIFQDTGSYFVSNYSMYGGNISFFVENKFEDIHFSFVINLEELLLSKKINSVLLPASAINPLNAGFENLAEAKIISFITGEKTRSYNPDKYLLKI